MLVVPVEISVLLESDFADVGRPMVHLYTLDQQAVLATMEHFQSLSTGLVQPVVATYSMIQLYKAAGLVQPVSDDAMAVLCHFRDCSTCCAR
jgi:hypothetical protein